MGALVMGGWGHKTAICPGVMRTAQILKCREVYQAFRVVYKRSTGPYAEIAKHHRREQSRLHDQNSEKHYPLKADTNRVCAT